MSTHRRRSHLEFDTLAVAFILAFTAVVAGCAAIHIYF